MTKQEILKKYFGYDSFREGQDELMDGILHGRDVLGIMPTGAGKSLCYQVPALMLEGITIVISPLISLMKDQVQALNQAGIHAAYINSSLSESQISKALQLASRGQYKIIYVAPERLETYEFMSFAQKVEISMITVDEAHCISQWGQDFRPSYLKIVSFIRQLNIRPVISAFTATATEQVKEDIICVLGLENPEVLVTGFDRANLYFAVEKPRKKDLYISNYVKEHQGESGIIYCATRKNVDKLYEQLSEEGIAVTRYHAGLGSGERKKNQDDFIYDNCPVMVATNAFGMGIDKSNVRYVLHYNMPQSVENYYQEAGRAGRDGEASECILLYSAQDMVINRFLLESKEQNAEFSMEENEAVRELDEKRLQQMNFYCQTQNCLRTYILKYFGEYGKEECGNCSNCQREYENVDVTEIAREVLMCIAEQHQRYGINVVVGTLIGGTTARLEEYHVSRYAAYGKLQDHSEAEIKQIIGQLQMDGAIILSADKYNILKTGPGAADILNGIKRVYRKEFQEDPKMEAWMQSSKSGKGGKSGSAKKRITDILNSRGLDLFERLRALRTSIAKEEGLPPYIVFSDKTLTDMCIKIPFDKSEMLNVSGVGENKYEKYGEKFIEEIVSFTGKEKEKTFFGEETQEEFIAANSPTTKKSKKAAKTPKAEFSLTSEQAKAFPYAEKYLAPEFAERLSALRDPETMKKITGADIFRYMQSLNYANEERINGRRERVVSEDGQKAGLFLGSRMSQKGTEYMDIYYSEKAQRMIVEYFTKEQ